MRALRNNELSVCFPKNTFKLEFQLQYTELFWSRENRINEVSVLRVTPTAYTERRRGVAL